MTSSLMDTRHATETLWKTPVLEFSDEELRCWKAVGRALRLQSSTQMALFLLKYYERRESSSSSQQLCTRCHTALVLTCFSCDSSSLIPPTASPSPSPSQVSSEQQEEAATTSHAGPAAEPLPSPPSQGAVFHAETVFPPPNCSLSSASTSLPSPAVASPPASRSSEEQQPRCVTLPSPHNSSPSAQSSTGVALSQSPPQPPALLASGLSVPPPQPLLALPLVSFTSVKCEVIADGANNADSANNADDAVNANSADNAVNADSADASLQPSSSPAICTKVTSPSPCSLQSLQHLSPLTPLRESYEEPCEVMSMRNGTDVKPGGDGVALSVPVSPAPSLPPLTTPVSYHGVTLSVPVSPAPSLPPLTTPVSYDGVTLSVPVSTASSLPPLTAPVSCHGVSPPLSDLKPVSNEGLASITWSLDTMIPVGIPSSILPAEVTCTNLAVGLATPLTSNAQAASACVSVDEKPSSPFFVSQVMSKPLTGARLAFPATSVSEQTLPLVTSDTRSTSGLTSPVTCQTSSVASEAGQTFTIGSVPTAPPLPSPQSQSAAMSTRKRKTVRKLDEGGEVKKGHSPEETLSLTSLSPVYNMQHQQLPEENETEETETQSIRKGRRRQPQEPGQTSEKMRRGSGKNDSTCLECATTFQQPGQLEDHLQQHSFICLQCPARYLQIKSLQKHVSRKHNGGRSYKCQHCSAAFYTKAELNVHQRTHTGLKPYGCDICGKRFAQSGHLKQHYSTHVGQKPFLCQQCGSTFSRASSLKQHMQCHNGEKPYVCVQCGKAYARAEYLKVHQRTHSGEKACLCQQCGSRFSCMSVLAQHVRKAHTSVSPPNPACKFCEVSFSDLPELLAHNQSVHAEDKPYQCEICGSAYSLKNSFKVHQRSHTGERPYRCKLCPATFAHSGHFSVHMRSHGGAKQYHCTECGRSFRSSSGFWTHKRHHAGTKPFSCQLCGLAYTQKHNLMDHMIKKHPDHL